MIRKNIRKETKIASEIHDRDIEKINDHRRKWLFASSVVYTGIIILIFAWDWIEGLHSKSVWWLIISLMLIISINWWYWTMRVLRKFMSHRELELNLILNIVHDIREIKDDVKKLKNEQSQDLGNR